MSPVIRFIRRNERPKGLRLARTAIGLFGLLVVVAWFVLVWFGMVGGRCRINGTEALSWKPLTESIL